MERLSHKANPKVVSRANTFTSKGDYIPEGKGLLVIVRLDASTYKEALQRSPLSLGGTLRMGILMLGVFVICNHILVEFLSFTATTNKAREE